MLGLIWWKRRPERVRDRINVELEAVRAATRARDVEYYFGLEKARTHIEDQYREQLERLNQAQQQKVIDLEDNPAELARYLERLSR